MRKFVFVNFVFATIGTALTSALLSFAVAHEAHRMECSETAMNAMNADLQSMGDGDAKTSAMKEMEIAKDMMAKKDMEACAKHMRNAMAVMED